MRATDNNKYIAEILHSADEGTELGFNLDNGDVIFGSLIDTREVSQQEDEFLVCTDGDAEAEYKVYVNYTGDEDTPHTSTEEDEYEVTALLAEPDDGIIHTVEAAAEFSPDDRSFDMTLSELAESVEEEAPDNALPAEEIREATEEQISHINTTISELQEMREGLELMLEDEETPQDFDRRLTEIELRHGGRAALEDW